MSVSGNEGQCALVTGASGGIGLELARVLEANRFSLVLLARTKTRQPHGQIETQALQKLIGRIDQPDAQLLVIVRYFPQKCCALPEDQREL